MKRKALALILALVLVFGLIPGTAFAAATPIELTVWAGYDEMTWLNGQLDAFEAANPQWNITWNVGVCPAVDAADMMCADPEAGADVYFFANDQLSMLTQAGALLPLTAGDAALALELTSESLMNTVVDQNGTYYGFPVIGNTWFMYYNKRIFSEEDVKSLETMLAKGKVAFPITNSWYLPAFYFANGCTMFGKTGANEAVGIRFNGKKGTAVTIRLAELVKHRNFVSDNAGEGVDGLRNGTVGAYFSGSWDYNELYEALGENLGAAQLPTVTIDGQSKQMKSFLGSIAIGVNPHTDHKDAARALARFLSNEQSQLLRWEMNGSIPAAAALAEDPSILAHPGAKAQMDTQTNTSVPQPSVPGMNIYWGPACTMSEWLLNGEITPENAAERTEEWNDLLNGGETPPIFSDVTPGAYYEDAVEWAVENGITTGTSSTTFSPHDVCQRAQVVTFLWRANGSPLVEAENPFVDVDPSDYYYHAVLWAVEKGITTGVDSEHFGPYQTCDRSQVVTFLWRTAGSPEPQSGSNPFTDVAPEKFYCKAVLWAVENGITNGLTSTEFGPVSPCSRAQVVTFLFRTYN